MITAYRLQTLPWTPVAEDERRFRRLLGGMALAAILLSIVMPWLPLPEVADDLVPEVPSRYARLIIEKPKPPPPPFDSSHRRTGARPDSSSGGRSDV